ncbi:hypothetical protein RJ639_032181 [Escallonia herrerae]|uniref:Transcription factor MYC/MYB N-terminal domain-containing protein n=1 Tax=Escallonia herrerae TaxID=1293975 RepID=A0AA89BJT9_9ASTE|nr:hypothetical protein RJ639_032181 [Escallonia herrerae]
MGSRNTPMRRFLESLCCDSPWNYAVFWKLQQQGQMLLAWEDGYCDTLNQRESLESLLDDICLNGSDEIFPFYCELTAHGGNLDGCSIGLAMACMSQVQYALGEG